MLDIISAGPAQSATRLGWTGVVRFLHLAAKMCEILFLYVLE